MDELEFLMKLQDLAVGTSTHDGIEIYCRNFKVAEKKEELEAQVTMSVRNIDWKKAGKYLEELLDDRKLREKVEELIIIGVKEAIKEKISSVRKNIREVLKIPEETRNTNQEETLI